jgi:hypothetical protein
VPLHVVGEDQGVARAFAEAVRAIARDPATVSSSRGAGLEDVIRQPVPLRPATGAVVVLADRRVVAAHFHRPPLRDAGGHVRPQGPAVLATWDPAGGTWEDFAWGVIPELADATGRRAGDFEIAQGRRREFLDALASAGIVEPQDVVTALRGYGAPTPPRTV